VRVRGSFQTFFL